MNYRKNGLNYDKWNKGKNKITDNIDNKTRPLLDYKLIHLKEL